MARLPCVAPALAPGQESETGFFRPTDGHWHPDQPPNSWDMGGEDGRGDVALKQRGFQQGLRGCQQLAMFVSPASCWVIVHGSKLYVKHLGDGDGFFKFQFLRLSARQGPQLT